MTMVSIPVRCGGLVHSVSFTDDWYVWMDHHPQHENERALVELGMTEPECFSFMEGIMLRDSDPYYLRGHFYSAVKHILTCGEIHVRNGFYQVLDMDFCIGVFKTALVDLVRYSSEYFEKDDEKSLTSDKIIEKLEYFDSIPAVISRESSARRLEMLEWNRFWYKSHHIENDPVKDTIVDKLRYFIHNSSNRSKLVSMIGSEGMSFIGSVLEETYLVISEREGVPLTCLSSEGFINDMILERYINAANKYTESVVSF